MSLDFHLHSTISDGRLSPRELLELASEYGVTTMALTDHDSTDGVADAQAVGAELGIRVIPGIELSTDLPGASIHVLGIFLDYQQEAFQDTIRQFREARIGRAQKMVDAVTNLGYPITVERVFELAGEGSVGRPHVAQALLEAGHVTSIEDAFNRFIGRNGPAYFEGFRIEPKDAVTLIHSVGGIASWAHPYELDGKDWREFLPAMLEAGVDGLETYYGKEYEGGAKEALLAACSEHGLVPTVGSDFHGFKALDRWPGTVPHPDDLLFRIEARVAARRRAAIV